MTKKLFIKTYGCQMNVYDSDRMTDVLAPLGYAPTSQADGADMVILNTCHIREKASEKVFSELGRLRMMKEHARDQQGRNVTIAVAGCVAQAEAEEITRRAPWVDIVVGPQTYHRLPELVSRADPAARARAIDTEFPEEIKFDQLPASMRRADLRPFFRCRKDATNSVRSVWCPTRAARNFRDRHRASLKRRAALWHPAPAS